MAAMAQQRLFAKLWCLFLSFLRSDKLLLRVQRIKTIEILLLPLPQCVCVQCGATVTLAKRLNAQRIIYDFQTLSLVAVCARLLLLMKLRPHSVRTDRKPHRNHTPSTVPAATH